MFSNSNHEIIFYENWSLHNELKRGKKSNFKCVFWVVARLPQRLKSIFLEIFSSLQVLFLWGLSIWKKFKSSLCHEITFYENWSLAFFLLFHIRNSIFTGNKRQGRTDGNINHWNVSWQIDFWVSYKKLPFLAAGGLAVNSVGVLKLLLPSCYTGLETLKVHPSRHKTP